MRRNEIISWWLLEACRHGCFAIKLLAEHGYIYDWIRHGDIGGARVKVHGRYFELDPDGQFMILQAVWHDIPSLFNWVESPLLFDVIAWHPKRPGRWYYLRGEAGLVIGEKAMFEALMFDERLLVHATPFEWIKSGCMGVVILDVGALHRLLGIKEVAFTDKQFAADVRKRLLRFVLKDVPKIYVSAMEEAE